MFPLLEVGLAGLTPLLVSVHSSIKEPKRCKTPKVEIKSVKQSGEQWVPYCSRSMEPKSCHRVREYRFHRFSFHSPTPWLLTHPALLLKAKRTSNKSSPSPPGTPTSGGALTNLLARTMPGPQPHTGWFQISQLAERDQGGRSGTEPCTR